jgi:hypothetical protein
MVDAVTAFLMDAIEELQKKPKSREVSLAITNAEQALMWWKASYKPLEVSK